MNPAKYYGRALFELVEHAPQKSTEYLHRLVEILKRRGHVKLLPRIYSEYRALKLAQGRVQARAVTNKEQERTRALVELYRRLIA